MISSTTDQSNKQGVCDDLLTKYWMRAFINIIEHASGGLAAMVHKRDDYVSEYESDGFENEAEAELAFDDLYELFYGLPNPLPVYRGMAVTPEWIEAIVSGQNFPLGVHWTYDIDAARADLAGHGHSHYTTPTKRADLIKVVICGEVEKSAVNWDWTFSKNLTYPDEAEIHLSDATVMVTQIIVENRVSRIGRTMSTGNIKIGVNKRLT